DPRAAAVLLRPVHRGGDPGVLRRRGAAQGTGPGGGAGPRRGPHPAHPRDARGRHVTEPDAQPWQRLHPDVLKVTALTMVGVAVLVGGVTAVIMLAAGVSLGVTLAWVLPGAVLPAAAVTGYDALRLRFTR